MTDLLPFMGVALTAAFPVIGVWLVQRNAKRATSVDATKNLIDTYQKDRQDDRAQFASARAEFLTEKEALQGQIDRAWKRLEEMETRERVRARETDMRERIFSQYIELLRAAVPPPPPDYPEELRRG